jgi:hypothetical protein
MSRVLRVTGLLDMFNKQCSYLNRLYVAAQARKAVRQLKKKWVSYLSKLTGITRSKINKIERNKTVSLITIEVHARDVIDKLAKVGCTAATDFEWVSQLRFYWDREQDDCFVKQVLSVFKYGYEYQARPFLITQCCACDNACLDCST